MSAWLGPNDPWDKHGSPEAQKALREAKAAGWWFKKSSSASHIFAMIVCHEPTTGARLGEDECKFRVFSTAGDSGETAKNIRTAVRSCPHKIAAAPDDSWHARVLRAEVLMDRAEDLLDAIGVLLADPLRRARIDELLDDFDESSDQVEELLDRATSADLDRAKDFEDALETLGVEPDGESEAPAGAVEASLAAADVSLDRARSNLGRSATQRGAGGQVARLRSLRIRAETLRGRVI